MRQVVYDAVRVVPAGQQGLDGVRVSRNPVGFGQRQAGRVGIGIRDRDHLDQAVFHEHFEQRVATPSGADDQDRIAFDSLFGRVRP